MTLFEVFEGQHINIMPKSIRGSHRRLDGSSIVGNAIISGYLVGENALYYLLSIDGTDVTDAVLKTECARVYTITVEDLAAMQDNEGML
jgi:hypothetical protein